MFAFRRRRCACCDVQLARDDGTLCADCIEASDWMLNEPLEEIELANRQALLAEEDAERRAERDRPALGRAVDAISAACAATRSKPLPRPDPVPGQPLPTPI